MKGIEPSQPAWKAGTLPLSYTRIMQRCFYLGHTGGWRQGFSLDQGSGRVSLLFITTILNGRMIQPCQQFFSQTHVFRHNHAGPQGIEIVDGFFVVGPYNQWQRGIVPVNRAHHIPC